MPSRNAALQRMHADGVAHGVPFRPIQSEYMDTNQSSPHDSRWSIDKSLGTKAIIRHGQVYLYIDDSYRAPRNIFYHP